MLLYCMYSATVQYCFVGLVLSVGDEIGKAEEGRGLALVEARELLLGLPDEVGGELL